MGLPAQLFLKCACPSRSVLYFVLNSDPYISHHLDTRVGLFVEMSGNPRLLLQPRWREQDRDRLVARHISPAKKATAGWDRTKVPGHVPLPRIANQETGR